MVTGKILQLPKLDCCGEAFIRSTRSWGLPPPLMARRVNGRFKLSSVAAIMLVGIALTWGSLLYIHSAALPEHTSDRRLHPRTSPPSPSLSHSSTTASFSPSTPSSLPTVAKPSMPTDEGGSGSASAKAKREGEKQVGGLKPVAAFPPSTAPSVSSQVEEAGSPSSKPTGGVKTSAPVKGEGGGGGALSPSTDADRTEFRRTTAIVVLSCSRPEYLSQTVESLLKLRGVDGYTIILSQDGNHGGVEALSQQYVRNARGMRIEHVHNSMRQNHGSKGDQAAIHYIADHYKFVLTHVFDKREEGQFKRAILIEEDMVLAKDFLTLFEEAGPLLDQDDSLMCISSWNDNGYKGFDLDRKRLFRSGFFPGLGWMLRRQLWQEWRGKWPKSHWDHWTRVDAQSMGRDCIVPEVSRNHNIGSQGATVDKGSFAERLSNIEFAGEGVDTFGDLGYLLKEAYRDKMRLLLSSSTPVSFQKAISTGGGFGRPGSVVRVGFHRNEWHRLAEKVGLYVSMWPRGHFDHAIVVRKHGATAVLFDVKMCGLVPDGEKELPRGEVKRVAARQGESCDTACREAGRSCDQRWFDLVNNCHDLQAAFLCQGGCSYEVGPDIPVYVSDLSHPNGGVCLVTDAVSTCSARHPSTSRLCPCL